MCTLPRLLTHIGDIHNPPDPDPIPPAHQNLEDPVFRIARFLSSH